MSESGWDDDRERAAMTAAEAVAFGRLLGIEVPEEDRELLAQALDEQSSLVADFDAIATEAGLAGDELTRTMPPLRWDPRWR